MKSITQVLVASAATALTLAAVVTISHGASAATSSSPAPTQVTSGACFDQGNMQSALNQLRGARAALDHAEHDKAGWREDAVKATDAAIAATVRGCQSAK
jgi:hypothetical protein